MRLALFVQDNRTRMTPERQSSRERKMKTLLLLMLMVTIVSVSYLSVPAQPIEPGVAD
jgi:hypothetical protein